MVETTELNRQIDNTVSGIVVYLRRRKIISRSDMEKAYNWIHVSISREIIIQLAIKRYCRMEFGENNLTKLIKTGGEKHTDRQVKIFKDAVKKVLAEYEIEASYLTQKQAKLDK